jgi:hypothetical protein
MIPQPNEYILGIPWGGVTVRKKWTWGFYSPRGVIMVWLRTNADNHLRRGRVASWPLLKRAESTVRGSPSPP